jgi:predicted HTH domain antitoxin
MKIEIQDDALQGITVTPERLLIDLAVGLYAGRRISMGRAARIAGLSQPEFLHELGRSGIPVNYDVEDFEADLRTLSELRTK